MPGQNDRAVFDKINTQMARFFTTEEEGRITDHIALVETQSTGEVRVYIEKVCEGDVKGRTLDMFVHYELNKTLQRNGVLIYIATETKVFYIWGDEGIHQEAGQSLWDHVISDLQISFSKGEFETGLIGAIDAIGAKLSYYFPRGDSDLNNELPDDIIYGG